MDSLEHFKDFRVPADALREAMIWFAKSVAHWPLCDDSGPRFQIDELSPVQLKAIWEHTTAGRVSYAIEGVPETLYILAGAELADWWTTAAEPAVEAVWLGEGRIQIGDEMPFVLPQQFATPLKRLIELGAAESEALSRDGGGAKKIRQMLERFPELKPYVRTPGRKGTGGYRTSIRVKS